MNTASRGADWRGAAVLEKFVSYCERKLWEGFPLQPSGGLRYLQRRGIDDQVVLRQRRVGYCPVGAESAFVAELAEQFPELKDPASFLVEIGLIDSSGHLAFADRVVIPVCDPEEAIQALYGRAVRADSDRPHLYSESAFQGLYNANHLDVNADTLIVTESILDALSLIQAGYTNATALCGSRRYSYGSEFALQTQTAKALLKLSATKICFMFDNDTDLDHVGHRCALNIMNQLLSLANFQEIELDLRLALLPDNTDVNELWTKCVSIGNAGPAEFRSLTEESVQEAIPVHVLRVRLAVHEMKLDQHTTRKLFELIQNEFCRPQAA